ncbi:MAG: diaminopimelate epimerase [Acidobacteria bacterium]|nr:diaminopimelate epimerase [Acidobacteriota bacterium]
MNSLVDIRFAKLSGAGNDFVVIDHRSGGVEDPASLARTVCTRRLSVGGDGLILLEHSKTETFRMRYFNADGSEADFCANGTRCAARYAHRVGIAGDDMTIETGAGRVDARVIGSEVELALQPPRGWQPEKTLETTAGGVIPGSALIVGVPHYVIWSDPEEFWTKSIDALGSEIRRHPDLGPAGANVNFVRVDGAEEISVRTWERGVEGETMACGSGVTASVAAAALNGKVRSPVTVTTRSGIVLTVSFELEQDQIGAMRLRGDARIVFESVFTPETLAGFDPEWVRAPRG